jgi:phage shock protein PspC (stress-responsive transcriptional regulator)
MNKTININLAGLIFHVDEDAYNRLSSYLAALKKQFSNEKGGSEIISDIEARVAELFTEKLTGTKQVITMRDVEDVIAIMGSPEDYEAENEAEYQTGSSTSTGADGKKRARRVFRDPDNSTIGGVCGGIGAYLNVDPLWLRLIFLLLFFGFGTGILLYIILWIVLPEAKTTAEKLEMRGEDVNIDNIERSIREEAENLKQRATKFGKKARAEAEGTGERIKNMAEQIAELVLAIIRTGLKVVLGIISVVITVIALILLTASLGFLFGFGNFFINMSSNRLESFDIYDIVDLIFISDTHMYLSVLAIALITIIPLTQLIFLSARTLFNVAPANRMFYRVSGALWGIGVILFIACGIFLVKEFEFKGSYTHNKALQMDSTQVLHITIDRDDVSRIIEDDRPIYVRDNGMVYLDEINFDIRKSSDSKAYMELQHYAKGSDKRMARDKAQNIQYEFRQDGDKLLLSNYLSFGKEDLWRSQEVQLTLYLPVGATVYLDHNMKSIIYDIKNTDDIWDYDMVGHQWTMTEKGLECVDCTGEERSVGRRRSQPKASTIRYKVKEVKSTTLIDATTKLIEWR